MVESDTDSARVVLIIVIINNNYEIPTGSVSRSSTDATGPFLLRLLLLYSRYRS